jgi:hypothetical protein
MWFKFFMVVCVWGLVPLLIPPQFIPFLGLRLTQTQIMFMRMWGVVVLLDTFLYVYIYRNPHTPLTKKLLIFSIADNAGMGTLLLILTPIYHFPWGIWINIPFQLFFGYWFWKFYSSGEFQD